MKKKNSNICIFYDIMFHYMDLKYIFEYGFSWDDDMTQMLLGKKSQTLRTLYSVIEDCIFEVPFVMWNESTGCKSVSKRKLIKKNRYRIALKQWYSEIYSAYGMFSMGNKQDNITAITKIEACSENYEYAECSKEHCEYMKLCQIRNEAQDLKMAVNPARNKHGKYADLFKYNNNGVVFKDNNWTYDAMYQRGIIKKREDYDRFIEMVGFLSEISVMSVLGFSFLRRLKVNFENNIFVRNFPISYALEQEQIYRCIYAIYNKNYIMMGQNKYIPLRLLYNDAEMYGTHEHLYLEAALVNEDNNIDRLCHMPLYQGIYVDVIKEKHIDIDLKEMAVKEKSFIFEVSFFSCRNTAYLYKKFSSFWINNRINFIKREKKLEISNVYYPHEKYWDVYDVDYMIKERDVDGFRQFINSFGEFAFIRNNPDIPVQHEKYDCKETRSRMSKASLMNLYNSRKFIDDIEKITPPVYEEVFWLWQTIRNYPGICSAFMGTDKIKMIKRMAKECLKRGNLENTVENCYMCSERIADVSEDTAYRMSIILNAIRNRRICTYKYNQRIITLFPYAVEYNLKKKIADEESRNVISVMCYSVTEKRNICVNLESMLNYVNSSEMGFYKYEEYKFEVYEKLYHILAYLIRCAVERLEIMPEVKVIVDIIWPVDKRSNTDGFSRHIYKRYKTYGGDKVSFYNKYNELSALFSDEQSEEVNNAFKFWSGCTKNEITQRQWKYLTFIIEVFIEVYNKVQLSSELYYKLENFNNDLIWKMIMSDDHTDCGEIAFYNEYFLHKEMSFIMRNPDKEKIDKIYGIFSEFICAGDILSDGSIRFNVLYETFNFRKIHMCILAADTLIDKIEDESISELIEKRKSYKMQNGMLL